MGAEAQQPSSFPDPMLTFGWTTVENLNHVIVQRKASACPDSIVQAKSNEYLTDTDEYWKLIFESHIK